MGRAVQACCPASLRGAEDGLQFPECLAAGGDRALAKLPRPVHLGEEPYIRSVGRVCTQPAPSSSLSRFPDTIMLMLEREREKFSFRCKRRLAFRV